MSDKLESPLYVANKIKDLQRSMAYEKRQQPQDTKMILSLSKEISHLERTLEKLSNGICVSDHALLRYIQRCMDIDTESIRAGLVNVLKNIHIGDGKYILGNGMYAIMKDGVVATIIDENVQYKSRDMK